VGLFKSAKEGYIPADGLDFTYANVDLIYIDNLDDGTLEDLYDDAEELSDSFDTKEDHCKYYEYLCDVIEHYFDNPDAWK